MSITYARLRSWLDFRLSRSEIFKGFSFGSDMFASTFSIAGLHERVEQSLIVTSNFLTAFLPWMRMGETSEKQKPLASWHTTRHQPLRHRGKDGEIWARKEL